MHRNRCRTSKLIWEGSKIHPFVLLRNFRLTRRTKGELIRLQRLWYSLRYWETTTLAKTRGSWIIIANWSSHKIRVSTRPCLLRVILASRIVNQVFGSISWSKVQETRSIYHTIWQTRYHQQGQPSKTMASLYRTTFVKIVDPRILSKKVQHNKKVPTTQRLSKRWMMMNSLLRCFCLKGDHKEIWTCLKRCHSQQKAKSSLWLGQTVV